MKIGDRCTSPFSISFHNSSSGRRTKYYRPWPISGVFLGYTYKQFGETAGDQEWVGGFYDKSIKVAVIMPVHGTAYRTPQYALPEDVEDVTE